MSSIYCGSCGTANEAGSRFCGNCGGTLAASAPTPMGGHVHAPTPAPGYTPVQSPPPTWAPPAKKKRGPLFWILTILGGLTGLVVLVFAALIVLAVILGDDLETTDDPTGTVPVTGQPVTPTDGGQGTQTAGGQNGAQNGQQTPPNQPEEKRIGAYRLLAEGALQEEPVHIINGLYHGQTYYLFVGWGTADGNGVVSVYEWLSQEKRFAIQAQFTYDSPLLDIAVGDLYNGTNAIATLVFENTLVFVDQNLDGKPSENTGIRGLMVMDYTGDGRLETLVISEDDTPGNYVYSLARFDSSGKAEWLTADWDYWDMEWEFAREANRGGVLFMMEPDIDDEIGILSFADGRFQELGVGRVNSFQPNTLNVFNGGVYGGKPALAFTQMLTNGSQEWRLMALNGSTLTEVHSGVTDESYFAYHLPVQLPGLSGSQLLTLDYMGQYWLLELP